MSECVGKEPEPEPDAPEPEKAEKPSIIGPVVVLLAMVLAGGSAACYLKFVRKKPDVSGSADLDDYDYGDEDESEEDWEQDDSEDRSE